MKKICKECGKEFEATNGRQKYCTGPHFRPCPMCGKQVEVKYLSDDTPKCADCRKHRTIDAEITVKRPADDIKEIPVEFVTLEHEHDKSFWAVGDLAYDTPVYDYDSATYVTRKYVGRSTCGFITNHIYTVALLDNPPGKMVHAKEDQTSGEDLNIGLAISNENSWNHFFKVV